MENITRRSALIAAAAFGLTAAESSAGETSKDQPGERRASPKPLTLHIVLPDGQTVDLKAAELVIDFGGSNRLLVKPDGMMPANDAGGQSQNRGETFPGPIEIFPADVPTRK
jgi:hypothetical protein